jgi:hypothetical protein
MDAVEFVFVAVTICGVIMAFFGWSHQTLSARMDVLTIDMQARKTDDEVRILLNDKFEVYKFQLEHLSNQMHELDRKIDSMLLIPH